MILLLRYKLKSLNMHVIYITLFFLKAAGMRNPDRKVDDLYRDDFDTKCKSFSCCMVT